MTDWLSKWIDTLKNTPMDDQRKDHSDLKRPPKGTPQQQQTHNVPTDDEENTNSTD